VTTREFAEQTCKALEEFNPLPPEEQVKRRAASGTIDAQGRVLASNLTCAPIVQPDGVSKNSHLKKPAHVLPGNAQG